MAVDPTENELAEREFNDKLAATYFDVWDEYPIQRYTNEVEQELIASLVEPGSRVLVLGVGGGRELPVLIDRACDITAVDISEEMLRLARARYGTDAATWLPANVSQLPNDLGLFDSVIAVGGVMNYQLDLRVALEGIAQHTVPGGVIVFDSFNKSFPGEKPEHEQAGRVRRSYTTTEVESASRAAGFVEVAINGHRFFVDQFPPAANRDASHPARSVLLEVAALEPRLVDVLPAAQAKILVVSGRRAG